MFSQHQGFHMTNSKDKNKPQPPAEMPIPFEVSESQSPAIEIQQCRLCQSPVQQMFSNTILGKHQVNYYLCNRCGALQTADPYWLDEAYEGSAELYDTGKASRTVVNFLALPAILVALKVRKTDLAVDFGGGTGLLARLMRDTGYNFHTCDKFGGSEFMGGYAWSSIGRPCKLVTLFEVAEHFSDPAEEWQRIFAGDPEWVIGSTSLYVGQDKDWPYLSCDSGQHVFFYSAETLAYVAHTAGRYAYNLGMYFLITRVPLDEETLKLISDWKNNLISACNASFATWTQGPYRHASVDNTEVSVYARLRQSGKRIAVDGTFFRNATDISRLWSNILNHWSASSLSQFIMVIDRGRTAPRLPGISYVDAPFHDIEMPEQDRKLLQDICDKERIGLFISTNYTIPLTTPSVLLVLDMIPEVMGYDMSDPQWLAKRNAIEYAMAFISISQSTEQDLVTYYPIAHAKPKLVTYCGSDFRAATMDQIINFKQRYGIQKPYFLISGILDNYKNAILFFKAFELFGDRRADFAIVCVNSIPSLEAQAAVHVGLADLHILNLTDAELQCAYSGAIALVYPSRYEGFGLPVLEAMACGCPVITCHNNSLPEVGAETVIYVDPGNADQMYGALVSAREPEVRSVLITQGIQKAGHFSWATIAGTIGQRLATWACQ